jgi:hypothetical protein
VPSARIAARFCRATPDTDVNEPPMYVVPPTWVIAYTTPTTSQTPVVVLNVTQSTFAVASGTGNGLAKAAGATAIKTPTAASTLETTAADRNHTRTT